MDEMYDGATISFADGKMTMTMDGSSESVNYTQDGDTIKVESSTYELGTIKVSGGSIVHGDERRRRDCQDLLQVVNKIIISQL